MIIITPYYEEEENHNFSTRRKYLDETIESVDKQNRKDLLHVIVDDGSKSEYYKKLQKKYLNSQNRIIIRRERKKSDILTCTNALNFGLDYCFKTDSFKGIDIGSHDIITFLHSDDLLIDVYKRLDMFNSGSYVFVYTDALIFFDDNDVAYKWGGIDGSIDKITNNMWVYGKLAYPTMTWKKDFLKELKTYNIQKYKLNYVLDPKVGCGEDVDLALSSLEFAKIKGCKIGYLKDFTAGYRIHNKSLASIRDQLQRASEENSVLIKHFGEVKSKVLHMRRMLARPECYFPFLMDIKVKFRKSFSKSRYLGS